MRRFRRRRRRFAALAVFPLAAVVTTTNLTFAASASDEAQLSTSKRTVVLGRAVRLSGLFPHASNEPVNVVQRRAGSEHFRLVKRTTTGDAGHFSVRVRPDATGVWRAQLRNVKSKTSTTTSTSSTSSGGGLLPGTGGTTEPKVASVDPRTDTELVRVRSRVHARVSSRHPLVGHAITVSGRVRPGGHRKVIVEIGGERLTTRTARDGSFHRQWTPDSTGRRTVRVIAKGNRVARGSRDAAGTITVFRPAYASYYGPGFYGGRTACGQTLEPGTLGVANKTLPCGTQVTLRYGSNQVTVAVIDRGPYVAGREYDLTEATKNRLGFPSTGTVLSSR